MTLNEFLNIRAIKVTCGEEKETMLTVGYDNTLSLYTTDSKYLHKYQKVLEIHPEMFINCNATWSREGECTSIDITFNPEATCVSLFTPKRKVAEDYANRFNSVA